MKYVAIDCETTGLIRGTPPELPLVIQIAIVLEDTKNIMPLEKLPSLVVNFRHDPIRGDWQALKMNWELLQKTQVDGLSQFTGWGMVGATLSSWGFGKNRGEQATLAGKNVGGFDRMLLPEGLREYTNHRCIDPGSVFMDWENGVPGLGTLTGGPVAHTALADALDVIRVLRRAYAPTWVAGA
jgi:hypothetical protein